MSKKIFFLTVLTFGLAFGIFAFFYFQKIFFWDNTNFDERSIAIYINRTDSFCSYVYCNY